MSRNPTEPKMKKHTDRIGAIKVVVCNKCLRACCWQGIFFCEDYMNAGTTEKSISELKMLNREHPSYWKLSLL